MDQNVLAFKRSVRSHPLPGVPAFARESTECAAAYPSRLVATSADIGWTSLLLEQMEGTSHTDIFTTRPTPDLTLLVALSGSYEIQALRNQRWFRAYHQHGAGSAIMPSEIIRMRWRNEDRNSSFHTAHLYLPAATLARAADEYRRVGQGCEINPCSQLVLEDSAVTQVVIELVRAMRMGASDLYAQQVGVWLASHLLFRHARQGGPEDNRNPGSISDRRLARTIEFMSANIDKSLTLSELAREAGVSMHHFGRIFKQKTGKTPAAMLTSMRMEDALSMIQTSDISIAEIARRCGYSRSTAFSAAFTRHYGESPTQARARRRFDG